MCPCCFTRWCDKLAVLSTMVGAGGGSGASPTFTQTCSLSPSYPAPGFIGGGGGGKKHLVGSCGGQTPPRPLCPVPTQLFTAKTSAPPCIIPRDCAPHHHPPRPLQAWGARGGWCPPSSTVWLWPLCVLCLSFPMGMPTLSWGSGTPRAGGWMGGGLHPAWSPISCRGSRSGLAPPQAAIHPWGPPFTPTYQGGGPSLPLVPPSPSPLPR